MKRFHILIVLLLPFLVNAQELKELSYIGALSDGFAPVSKDGKWGFINAEGVLVVEFRDDLITNPEVTKTRDLGIASQKYPVMQENRAIIKNSKDGVNYYGFINENGRIIIEPEFLNVSTFKNGFALALKVDEEEIGRNKALDKRIISYKYDVVLIDTKGEVVKYLSGPFPVSISREKLREAPPITARFLGDKIIGVRGPDKLWEIFKI